MYVAPNTGRRSASAITFIGQPPLFFMACSALMYTASTSGRSSRSTLMQMKFALRYAATSSLSNDSCSITWHQ
jgi:hypothetical protein